MSLRRTIALGIAVAAACGVRAAAAPAATSKSPAIETGPALGWTFPLFTDKEGYHLLTLRGEEARLLGPDRIEVKGFSAIVFSGDASERVDTVLLSPAATFFPQENRAAGRSSVRLLLSGKDPSAKDDIEVLGRDWTLQVQQRSDLNRATKKVSIAHDTRVTFHLQLNDILK